LRRLGKKQNLKFKVLYQYPLVTSGRNGEFSLQAISRLVFSTVVAIAFFLLHILLPDKLKVRAKSQWLHFWYKR